MASTSRRAGPGFRKLCGTPSGATSKSPARIRQLVTLQQKEPFVPSTTEYTLSTY
jgi:hypothetical protein